MGPGVASMRPIEGGVVGIVLDGRGRPLTLPADSGARLGKLTEWNRAMRMYPDPS